MGWWQDGQMLLGDGPLDLAEAFLAAIREEYLDEQGRRPTLDELLETLSRVLSRSPAEFLTDVEGGSLEIRLMAARAAKSPTMQVLRPGDIFEIPLGDRKKSFGRLTRQHALAEFFDVVAEEDVSSEAWKNAAVFRFPFLIDTSPLERGSWKVVAHEVLPENAHVRQDFLVGGQVTCGEDVVDGFVEVSSQLRRPSTDDASLPKLSIANEAFVIQKLRRKFSLPFPA